MAMLKNLLTPGRSSVNRNLLAVASVVNQRLLCFTFKYKFKLGLALSLGLLGGNMVFAAARGNCAKLAVLSGNANMQSAVLNAPSALTQTNGPASYNYNMVVSTTASTAILTIKAQHAAARVAINGATGTLGSAAVTVAISPTPVIVDIEITAEDGVAKLTYRITVTKSASMGSADLTGLTPGVGTFTPAFNPATTSYSVTVSYATTTMQLTPVAADIAAGITVNGVAKNSGWVATVALATGPNVIPVVVTNGGLTKTYTVTITRQYSNNAEVKTIAVNQPAVQGNTLRYANESGPVYDHYYSLVVSSAASSATVTATADDADAKVAMRLEGAPVTPGTSGAAAITVPVSIAPGVILFTITAGAGNVATYKLTVLKATALHNANMAKMELSEPATVTGTTGPGNYNYNMAVTSAKTSAILKITPQDAGATIVINGGAPRQGIVSREISLNTTPGVNTIAVTAADGTTKLTYRVTVTATRPAAPHDAGMLSAVLNQPSAMASTTGPANYNYNLVATGSMVPSATLTIKAKEAGASVSINGAPGTLGVAAATVALNSSPAMVVGIEITAPDGTTKLTYQISVNRAFATPSTNLLALFSNFGKLTGMTHGGGSYYYPITVSNQTDSITLTPVASWPQAVIKVNNVTVGNAKPIRVALNGKITTIPVSLTADGVSAGDYSVIVTRNLSNNGFLAAITMDQPTAISTSTGPGNYAYLVVALTPVSTGLLTLTAQDAAASISINGGAYKRGVNSISVPLSAETVALDVLVRSEDLLSSISYRINVKKSARTSFANVNDRNTVDIVQKQELTPEVQPEELTVKQAVSPNGDSINDRFTIAGISAFPNNIVRVLNSTGVVIYEAKGYDNETKAFDGRNSKGVLQNAGTYFYSVEYKKGTEVKHKTGYMVLKY